jgi:UDP-glucose 4-epimerase
VQKLAGRPLSAYEVDIRDRDALGEVFAAHPIDAVVPAGILNSASGAAALSQG